MFKRPSAISRVTMFLKQHIVGVALFAVITGIAGNFGYDCLKSTYFKILYFTMAAAIQPTPNPGIHVSNPITDPALRQFIEDYVLCGNNNSADAEAKFFSEPVLDYFGKRNVTHDEIVSQNRAYIAKWPIRKYSLDSEPQLLGVEQQSTCVIMVRIRYYVHSAISEHTGISSSVYRIRQDSGKFQIVSAMEALAK